MTIYSISLLFHFLFTCFIKNQNGNIIFTNNNQKRINKNGKFTKFTYSFFFRRSRSSKSFDSAHIFRYIRRVKKIQLPPKLHSRCRLYIFMCVRFASDCLVDGSWLVKKILRGMNDCIVLMW